MNHCISKPFREQLFKKISLLRIQVGTNVEPRPLMVTNQ